LAAVAGVAATMANHMQTHRRRSIASPLL